MEESDDFYEKGKKLFGNGKYSEALDFFEKASENDQNNENIIVDKGKTLYKLNRKDEAITCFDEALKVNPDSVYAKIAKREFLPDKVRRKYRGKVLMVVGGFWFVFLDVIPVIITHRSAGILQEMGIFLFLVGFVLYFMNRSVGNQDENSGI